jgi:hypothetical protein
MIIELTQFVRPNGHKRPTSCEIDDDLASKVKAIRDAGLRLTAEVIGPNVSFCIEDDEEDLAIEIAANGPGENGTKVTLERLIRNFQVAAGRPE